MPEKCPNCGHPTMTRLRAFDEDKVIFLHRLVCARCGTRREEVIERPKEDTR